MKAVTIMSAILAYGSLNGYSSGMFSLGEAILRAAIFTAITITSFVIENIREEQRRLKHE